MQNKADPSRTREGGNGGSHLSFHATNISSNSMFLGMSVMKMGIIGTHAIVKPANAPPSNTRNPAVPI